MEEIKCEQIGQIVGSGFTEMTGRVYSIDGLTPSIRTFGGGNTEVKIAEPIIFDDTYGFENEPREYAETCPTLRADRQGLKVVESIIYDDYNGRIRTDQDRIGTLTTNCGNYSLHNGVKIIEPIAYDEQNGYIRQDGGVGTLTTDGSSPKHNNRVVEPNYRIRKLTERECFRLMGVKEEDFERVAKHQSTSALYHEAGDSIVTTCLMAILGKLFGVNYENKITELVSELKQGE